MKHYALPYLKSNNTYESTVGNANQELSKNIGLVAILRLLKKKWETKGGILWSLYNGKWKSHLRKRTHVSALCEYFFAQRN